MHKTKVNHHIRFPDNNDIMYGLINAGDQVVFHFGILIKTSTYSLKLNSIERRKKG